MTNTDDFYRLISDHQTKHAALDSDYSIKKQKLERFKGSRGYDEDLDAIKREYQKQVKSLAARDKEALKQIVDRMREVNSRRPEPAPTADETSMLQMLRMRDPKSITSDELTRLANSLQTDAARGVLRDFAKINHIFYHQEPKQSTNVSIAATDEKIRFLYAQACELFDDSAQPAARLWAERQAKRYGNKYDVDDLPRRPQITEKREAFGMSTEQLAAFCEAVD
ncbi:MAG: hypothetical protein IKE43_04900 [Coriobacteriales bacterium]|nr:hypothetical protein [Coriobacteriales bacterium]